jgi:type II secretory pathway component PulC
MLKFNLILLNFFAIIAMLRLLPVCTNPAYSYSMKNPFVSPFKKKQTLINRHQNTYNLNLQAIVASSESDLNIAIINNKPYYINSKILPAGKIINITKDAVIIQTKKGKILQLILKKFEGFQN